MNRPGRKYFRGRRIHGDRVIHFAVWDGVLNYQNAPPLRAIALAEKMPGTPLHVKVDAAAVEDLRQIIEASLRTCPEVGGLVVWAQDHQTYRRIVQQADRGRKHGRRLRLMPALRQSDNICWFANAAPPDVQMASHHDRDVGRGRHPAG